MAKKKDRVETMVRIQPEVKQAFKMAVLRLALSDAARFDDSPPTMELVTAALWRWFGSLPQAEAEAFLAREFPRLEAVRSPIEIGEPDIPGHSPSASPRKRKGRSA